MFAVSVRLGAAAAIVTLAACASATVIPMRGSAADLSALSGEWLGTFASPDLGREGTIWFTLKESEDHAHGDVRMTPRGHRPYGRFAPTDVESHQPAQFLSITFVRVSAREVDGRLDQYWDPDCGCLANTTFHGQLRGDRLEGGFETRLATGIVTAGTWRVTRKIYR